MRVIAGKNRSIKLHSITGNLTRPTTDKVKESLFNIIGQRMEGYIVIDLFAGSGALGVEALSRGAKKVFFIEKNFNAIKIIKKNIAITNNIDISVVMRADWQTALNYKFFKEQLIDVVFIDPPYHEYKDKYQKIFENILAKIKLSENAYIVFEHDTKLTNELFSDDFLKNISNERWQCKLYNYGNSSLTIFKKN